MAASDARPIPRRNVAYRVTFPILDADGDLVTGAGSLDSEVSKDGGTFADCTNEATEIATSSGVYFLDLTATEMDADTVALIVKSAGGKTTPIVLYPEEAGDVRVDVVQVSGDTTAADNLEAAYDGAGYAGGTIKQQVDAVAISGDTAAADNLEAAADGTGYNLGGGSVVAASVTGAVGSVTGAVGSVAAGGISASSIAADAITAAKIADGAIDAATFAAGAITAGAIAADAIGASELAADAASEVATAVRTELTTELARVDVAVSTRLATAGYTAPPTAAANADAVWDEATSDHVASGSFGQRLASIRAGTAQAGAAGSITLDAGASASDDFYNSVLVVITGGAGAGQARFVEDYTGSTKVATVSPNWVTTPSATSVFVLVPFDTLPGASAPSAADVADAVWDEALAGHLGAGSTGNALNAAGAAGDPWSTALPGAYGAGTAGKIVGDNVNATIGSRATQVSVDAIDDLVDTEVAAIKAQTDQLVFSGADVQATLAGETVTVGTNNDKSGYSLSSAGVQAIWDALTSALTTASSIGKLLVDTLNATISSRASQASVDTVDDFLDTEVAAIKAKTDLLTFTSGDVHATLDGETVAVSTLAANSITASALAADAVDEILDDAIGDGTITVRQALRVLIAGMAGKLSGAATTTVTIRNVADSADVIVATVDANGNRSAVTVTP